MVKLYEYKDSILNKIHKNRRRIKAYIRQSQIKRVKAIVLLLLFVSGSFSSTFAIENTDIYYGQYQILCRKDTNTYIYYSSRLQANYIYYYVKDGIEYPAYCLNCGLKGAEDYESGYTVDANEKISDNALQSIILHAYPYKSVEELGLDSEYEAIFASQFAIWCYLDNLDLNAIVQTNESYSNVVTAIKNIYSAKDISINENAIDLDMSVSDQNVEKVDNTLYYTKNIILDTKNINSINMDTSDENITIKQLSQNEYKVYIPVEKVTDEYNVALSFNINAKENVALFGATTIDGFQNIAVTLKTNFDTVITKEINLKKYESTVTITKKDVDTNDNIEGVTYTVTNKDTDSTQEYVTDKNGNITFTLNNISSTKLYIQETQSAEGYRLDEKIYEVEVGVNDNIDLTYYNEKQKGQIEIIKKTKEYNEYTSLPENSPLENVEFDILDENGKVVDSVKTDKYGVAQSIELPLGTYYIKEIKTVEYYELLDEEIVVNITNDEENVTVQILNDNVYIEKKLPVTGR